MKDQDFFSSNLRFHFAALLLAATAFALYLFSSALLEQRSATRSFGADSWHYAQLAEGRLTQQLADRPDVIRITRFHPVTVASASAWVNLLKPLTAWIAPATLLKAFFAVAGAFGVWAAAWALAAAVPRRLALIGAAICALSVSVWYFSSIEESKIVSASLAMAYIALYMRLRRQWSLRGFLLLTLVLLLACLNEIVAIFLVAIPFMETFARAGFDWRSYRWIMAHGLAGPLAILVLEIAGGLLLGPEPGREWQSHFQMFLYYMQLHDHGLASLYAFILNWLFFSVAAPTQTATHLLVPPYGGYFAPVFSNYFSAPWPGAAIILIFLMAASTGLRKFRGDLAVHRGLLLGLACYSLVRALFFFVFSPVEPFLFSASTVLPHVMLAVIPLAASRLPVKEWLLGILAILLLITNTAFMLNV